MIDQPSSLALKLAARFAPKKPDAAKDIDNIIEWHASDKREAIRQSNKLLPSFMDNVRVFHGADRNEFFELQLLPPEPGADYEVMFKRYAVPGRCWTYAFRYEREGSGRVIYGSEHDGPISKALKMLEVDLNKPQVVRLFERAFGAERVVCRYWRDTLSLLGMIAPKSKTYRITQELCQKTLDEREARIEAAKKAKEQLTP